MIIEFTGVPGSGKSTVSLVVRQTLRDLGLKAMLVTEAGPCCLKRALLGSLICLVTPRRWQERVLWGVFRRLIVVYQLKFAIQNRVLTRQAVSVLTRHQLPWRDRRSILRWFFRDAGYYQFFQKRLRSEEVLILDEGLVHRATSLYTSASEEPDPLEVADYVKLLPRPDLVVGVQTLLDICVARVSSRGGNRRYLDKDLVPFLVNSAKVIEIALQGIKGMGWDILEVKNNGKLDIDMEGLSHFLQNRGFLTFTA
jgi:thymidylate kinase